jgi:hypothetical protein
MRLALVQSRSTVARELAPARLRSSRRFSIRNLGVAAQPSGSKLPRHGGWWSYKKFGESEFSDESWRLVVRKRWG